MKNVILNTLALLLLALTAHAQSSQLTGSKSPVAGARVPTTSIP
jgi:hypothetical protein